MSSTHFITCTFTRILGGKGYTNELHSSGLEFSYYLSNDLGVFTEMLYSVLEDPVHENTDYIITAKVKSSQMWMYSPV